MKTCSTCKHWDGYECSKLRQHFPKFWVRWMQFGISDNRHIMPNYFSVHTEADFGCTEHEEKGNG